MMSQTSTGVMFSGVGYSMSHKPWELSHASSSSSCEWISHKLNLLGNVKNRPLWYEAALNDDLDQVGTHRGGVINDH